MFFISQKRYKSVTENEFVNKSTKETEAKAKTQKSNQDTWTIVWEHIHIINKTEMRKYIIKIKEKLNYYIKYKIEFL